MASHVPFSTTTWPRSSSPLLSVMNLFRRRAGTRVEGAGPWSANLDEVSSFEAAHPEPSPDQPWSNYVRGGAWALRQSGCPSIQVDLTVESDIPLGAGLSSSAALEVATVGALAAISGAAVPNLEAAEIAHQAETEFVGIPRGIMDQYGSAFGAEGSALSGDAQLISCTETLWPVSARRWWRLMAGGLAL